MKNLLLITPALFVLCACSSKTDPSEANFGAGIDAYLTKKGALCLNDETWPVEIDRRRWQKAAVAWRAAYE